MKRRETLNAHVCVTDSLKPTAPRDHQHGAALHGSLRVLCLGAQPCGQPGAVAADRQAPFLHIHLPGALSGSERLSLGRGAESLGGGVWEAGFGTGASGGPGVRDRAVGVWLAQRLRAKAPLRLASGSS